MNSERLVSISGRKNTLKQLDKLGLEVTKSKQLLSKSNGVIYHLPRSLKRELDGSPRRSFRFKLKELSKPTKTSEKPKAKKNDTWDHSQFIVTKNYWTDKPTKKPKTAYSTYIATEDAVSFWHEGVMHSTSTSNPMYSTILDSVKAGKLKEAVELVNVAKAIEVASNGLIKNMGGNLSYQNELLNETVQEYIIRNLNKGQKYLQPAINFLGRCKLNENQDSIRQLWQFIRNCGLVLCSTGEFIAYKYITDDFLDAYTKKIDNSIGKTVSMDRKLVEMDEDKGCGAGLHVGNFEYSGNKSTVVECICCPSKVVSVPKDHNFGKLRTCEYRVWKILRHKGQNIAERTKDLVKLD